WSEIVHQLIPYVPGEQPKAKNLIKLNTNENPYAPSPKVIEAIKAEVGEQLKLYPDPTSKRLKMVIAGHYGLAENQVFVGNGSDEVLAHVFQALLKQSRPLLFPDITYSFYPVYCGLYGINYEAVPLDRRFEINIHDYDRPNGGIIFPNPNAPTGIPLELDRIEVLLEKNRHSVVVIDEAYVDFGTESSVKLINQYPNLLVTQTLSKARSLAGLRVGYALGHPDLIEALTRVKDSFNSYPIDRLAEVGAIAAIEDVDHFEMTCQKVVASRDYLVKRLEALGFIVLPSGGNFIFTKHPAFDNGADLAARLRENNIITRHFKQPERISPYLRITIGTEMQMQELVDIISSICRKKANLD
ncbi:MAG TPA: histidinol-phosphate transaminase, partial [Methylophilaceae bacterium]|nr:histidinol-phosphate transaminase [Methylophilaceae bacterium]